LIPLSHGEAELELAGVALESSSRQTAERVRAHAAECEACAMRLHGFSETSHKLGRLIPQQSLNPGRAAGIRSRLLSRASADTDLRQTIASSPYSAKKAREIVKPARAPAATPVRVREAVVASEEAPRSFFMTLPGWITIAAIAAIAAAVWFVSQSVQENHSLRAGMNVPRRTTDGDSVLQKLRADLIEKDAVIAGLTNADARTVDLTNRASRGPLARVFWDPRSNSWTLIAYNIRQPRAGKIFQLWLMTTQGKRSVGVFAPDAQGGAYMRGTVSVPRDALEWVSITEEEMGGAPAPSGPIVLAGTPAR
jgi:hypothetical protein